MEVNTRIHCLIRLSIRVVLVGLGCQSQTSIRLGGGVRTTATLFLLTSSASNAHACHRTMTNVR
jgi:hypothetical protein